MRRVAGCSSKEPGVNDGGNSKKNLIEIDDLKVHFEARTGLFRTSPVKAVDGVSVYIQRGETLALVGESGCGKTTLGRALLRLVEPTSGSVVFDGVDTGTLTKKELRRFRRRAQAIFQDPYSSMSPYMTVREIVAEPLRIHRIIEEHDVDRTVLSSIDQVKLAPAEEIVGKYPHGLSGGQRQRVSVARALTLEPEFIVADEPVSMVDASNRVEILSLLRELQRKYGIAFLYITHDIAGARHFSDRIAVMYLGTIVETGPTEQVIENPRHPYTQGLLAAVPEPDPANRTRLRPVMEGELPSAASVPSGCPFHPRCPHFMPGICDQTRPQLEDRGGSVSVACYLYDERYRKTNDENRNS